MILHRVILLSRDEKRVKNFKSNIEPIIPDIQTFEAVDCETDEIENFLDKYKNIKIYRAYADGKSKRGGVANVISHMKLWKEMIDKNIQEMVILEDDANVPDDYFENLSDIKNELPNDYDLCNLFLPDIRIKKVRKDKSLHLPNKNLINKGIKSFGMVAYLISLSGAKKLLKDFEVIAYLVDVQMNRLIGYQETNGYKFFAVKERIVNKTHNSYLPTTVQKTENYVPHNPDVTCDSHSTLDYHLNHGIRFSGGRPGT